MADLVLLEIEVVGDPLVRGYPGMSNRELTDDINTTYRDGPADEGALFNYLAKETAKDAATENSASHILGRLYKVDEAGTPGIDGKTFAGSEPAGPFSALSQSDLDACRTLLQIALGDRLSSLSQVMTEAKFVTLLDRVKDTGVMKPADVTAIQALSQNKQSRASELQIGFVREGDVAHVRAL